MNWLRPNLANARSELAEIIAPVPETGEELVMLDAGPISDEPRRTGHSQTAERAQERGGESQAVRG
jgi:hypothetical protein